MANHQITKNYKDKHTVQTVLDVFATGFDLPIRLTKANFTTTLKDNIADFDEVITAYKNTKPKNFISNNKDAVSKIPKLLDDLYEIYPANNSTLSFRMDLHDNWHIIRVLADYLVISRYEQNDDNDKNHCYNYITDDFFVYIQKIEILDNAIAIIGPFLELKEKTTCSNEKAIKVFKKLIENVFDGKGPEDEEYLKLGSEFFSCSKDNVLQRIKLFDQAINGIFQIKLDAKSGLQCDDKPILSKRHWMFFAFCILTITRHQNIDQSETVTFYHDYQDEDDTLKSAQLKAIIRNHPLDNLFYSDLGRHEKAYLDLEVTPDNKLKDCLKGWFKEYLNISIFSTEERRLYWEETFTDVIRQTTKKINAIVDKRTAVIEQYLNSNWQLYLHNQKELSQKICQWTNLILRSSITFLYEYDHNKDKLIYKYSSQTLEEVINLNEANGFSFSDRKQKTISYRCLYKDNRQYIHCQSVDKKISVPKNQSFTPYNNNQSCMAHTLTYHNRPLGVIELQGQKPYHFRHANLYKLGQLATFFGEYFYKVKTYQHLRSIIDEAAKADNTAYNKQCQALMQLFLCSAAGIWIRNAKNNYQLKGFAGLNKINDILNIENNAISFQTKSDSLGAQFLREREKASNKESFFWSKKYQPIGTAIHKKILSEYGLKHIMLFAVDDINADDENLPRAVISIHNTADKLHAQGYNHMWQEDVAYIARFIASSFSIMHSQEQQERERVNLFTHDLRTNIRQLVVNSENMLNNIISSKMDDRNKTKYIKFLVKNDLQPIAQLAWDQIDALSSEGQDTPPQVWIKAAQQKISHHYISFRQAYNKAFENRDKNSPIRFTPLIGKEIEWLVRMNADHLNQVLINVIENAQKYATVNTEVEVKLEQDLDVLVFTISNYSKKLQDEEESFSIPNYGFRGTNAIDYAPGKGLGLWQAQQVIILYDDTLIFDYQSMPNQNRAFYSVKIRFYQQHYQRKSQ